MKCSICKYNEISEYGNNAQPINNGECCNWCNANFVLPARLKELKTMNKNVS